MEAPTAPPDTHFQYWGKQLPYFYHLYNLTHLNERMVELALAFDFLQETPRELRNVGIEVGNVLGHYKMCRHEVIDLYEEAAWYQKLTPQPVYNWDIFDKERSLTGPWVLSLSTIEHTTRPLKALERLKSMVTPGGKLLVTFPTGERDELDEYVLDPGTSEDWTRLCTITRAPGDPAWQNQMWWRQDLDPRVTPYGPWAQTVAVLEWDNPNDS